MSSLRDQIARSIRDAVRLRYGPNARDILERGGEFCLNSGEAEAAAGAALAVIQPELDKLWFFREVLRVFADADLHGDLFWGGDDNGPRLYALVNDVFYWGTADTEEITPERLPVLLNAHKDLFAANSVDGPAYLADLYAARIRQMRPQGAAYPKEPEIAALFDGCGPRRDTGMTNPKEQS